MNAKIAAIKVAQNLSTSSRYINRKKAKRYKGANPKKLYSTTFNFGLISVRLSCELSVFISKIKQNSLSFARCRKTLGF